MVEDSDFKSRFRVLNKQPGNYDTILKSQLILFTFLKDENLSVVVPKKLFTSTGQGLRTKYRNIIFAKTVLQIAITPTQNKTSSKNLLTIFFFFYNFLAK